MSTDDFLEAMIYPGGSLKWASKQLNDKKFNKLTGVMKQVSKLLSQPEYNQIINYMPIETPKNLFQLENIAKSFAKCLGEAKQFEDGQYILHYLTIRNLRWHKTRRMKLLENIQKQNDLKRTPPVVHHVYRYTPQELCDNIINWGIKNVGVDFDQTLIKGHTGGYAFDVEKMEKHDYVVDLIRLLLKRDIRVAIVTFCYRNIKKVKEYVKKLKIT